MFKRKTKPAHVRKHTHTSSHWLSRTYPAREKREAEGKNTKDWKRTQSLLSNDTRLEENLDKTRQSGKNWSVWRFDIQAGKPRSGQNCRFFIKSPPPVFHREETNGAVCDLHHLDPGRVSIKHWTLLQIIFKCLGIFEISLLSVNPVKEAKPSMTSEQVARITYSSLSVSCSVCSYSGSVLMVSRRRVVVALCT